MFVFEVGKDLHALRTPALHDGQALDQVCGSLLVAPYSFVSTTKTIMLRIQGCSSIRKRKMLLAHGLGSTVSTKKSMMLLVQELCRHN